MITNAMKNFLDFVTDQFYPLFFFATIFFFCNNIFFSHSKKNILVSRKKNSSGGEKIELSQTQEKNSWH